MVSLMFFWIGHRCHHWVINFWGSGGESDVDPPERFCGARLSRSVSAPHEPMTSSAAKRQNEATDIFFSGVSRA